MPADSMKKVWLLAMQFNPVGEAGTKALIECVKRGAFPALTQLDYMGVQERCSDATISELKTLCKKRRIQLQL